MRERKTHNERQKRVWCNEEWKKRWCLYLLHLLNCSIKPCQPFGSTIDLHCKLAQFVKFMIFKTTFNVYIKYLNLNKVHDFIDQYLFFFLFEINKTSKYQNIPVHPFSSPKIVGTFKKYNDEKYKIVVKIQTNFDEIVIQMKGLVLYYFIYNGQL